MRKSKLALELQEAGPSSASEDRMVVGWEELQDLKVVWSELSRIWEQIDEMKDTPWLSVHPRKLRQQMDLLLNQLKDLLTGLWQYASYEYVKKLIQSFKKVNRLIVELTSGALKDRHWMTLCMQLRVSWVLSELTLGQVRAKMENELWLGGSAGSCHIAPFVYGHAPYLGVLTGCPVFLCFAPHFNQKFLVFGKFS